MIVELVGLPGCGKSTVAKAIQTLTAGRDLNIVPAYGSPLEVYAADTAPRFIKRHPQRRLLYHSLRFRAAYPALAALLDVKLPPEDINRAFLFQLNAALHLNATEDPKGLYLFDEGLIHRGIDLFEDPTDLAAFVDATPRADIVVHLRLDPLVSLQRCIARIDKPNATARVKRKFGGEDYFRARAARTEAAIAQLDQTASKVITCDATAPAENTAATVLDAIKARHP